MKKTKTFKNVLCFTCAALLASSLVFGLAGCGGLGDDGGDDDVTKPLPEREIEIKVSILNTASEKRAMSAFRKAFYEAQDKIGVKVEYLQGGTQYINGIVADYSSGILADVVWTSGDHHSPLSSRGVFANLKEFVEAEEEGYLDDFYPAILDSARLSSGSEDELYFMPRDYDKVVVAYNRDMLTAAGVDFPEDDWTWEDFLEKARAVRAKMDDNADLKAGLAKRNYPIDGNLSWEPVAYTMLRGFGGDVYQDGNYENAFTQNGDSSKAKEYFETVKMLASEKLAGIDTHNGSGLFAANCAAFAFLSRPDVADYVSSYVNFDFAPFPRMECDAVGVGCVGYAISSKSEKKEAAWEFLKFIASQEGQEAFARTGTGIPVRISMAQSPIWLEWKPDYMTYTPHNAVFTMNPHNDISVNYFATLDPKVHSEAVNRFKLAVQNAEEWTETGGWDGKGKDYDAWFTSIETTIRTKISALLG